MSGKDQADSPCPGAWDTSSVDEDLQLDQILCKQEAYHSSEWGDATNDVTLSLQLERSGIQPRFEKLKSRKERCDGKLRLSMPEINQIQRHTSTSSLEHSLHEGGGRTTRSIGRGSLIQPSRGSRYQQRTYSYLHLQPSFNQSAEGELKSGRKSEHAGGDLMAIAREVSDATNVSSDSPQKQNSTPSYYQPIITRRKQLFKATKFNLFVLDHPGPVFSLKP